MSFAAKTWLKVIAFDRNGYITLDLSGKRYERQTSYYTIQRFLRKLKYNQGRARVWLWDNSEEINRDASVDFVERQSKFFCKGDDKGNCENG